MTAIDDYLDLVDTPFYLYDRDSIAVSIGDLSRALPSRARLLYSIKSNPHPEILACALGAGAGFEASSLGELDALAEIVRIGDVPLVFDGPGKRRREFHEALRRGARLFSVDSIHGAEVLDQTAKDAVTPCEYMIRVRATQGTVGSLRMGAGPGGRFGSAAEDIVEALLSLSTMIHARLVGVHFFPVSNATPGQVVENLRASLLTLADLAQNGVPTRVVNLGGGFAAPFAREDDCAATVEDLDHVITTSVAAPVLAGSEVFFESGRAISARAGTLVAGVCDVKFVDGRRYVVLDSGINHLGGMAALGRTLRTELNVRVVRGTNLGGAGPSPATLVGPLCTPADVLGTVSELPPVRPDDVLAIPNVGAYGLSASLGAFLGHPFATEVVHGGGLPPHLSRQHLVRTHLLLPHTDDDARPMKGTA